MNYKELINSNKLFFALFVFLTVMPLVTSIILGYQVPNMEPWLTSLSVVEILILFVVVSVMLSIGFSTSFIAVASGFIWGWPVFVLVCVSYLMASMYGFLVATRLDKGKLLRELGDFPEINVFLTNIKDLPNLFTFFSRVSPMLPFAMTNYLLSVLGIRWKSFVLFTFLGMLPRTTLFFWLGTQLKSILEVKDASNSLWVRVVMIGMVTISLIFIMRILNGKLKKQLKGL